MADNINYDYIKQLSPYYEFFNPNYSSFQDAGCIDHMYTQTRVQRPHKFAKNITNRISKAVDKN